MADDTDARKAERIEKRGEVGGQQTGRGFLCRLAVLAARVAEAAQIGCDDVEACGQSGDILFPAAAELRPAVQQNQRRPAALAEIIHHEVCGLDAMVGKIRGGLVHTRGNL